MAEIVAAAMPHGALGFSTGLAYTPGAYSTHEEVVGLAKVAASFGGIYVTHIRDEAAGGIDALYEALEVGYRAQMPVQLSHFKVSGKGQWHQAERRLDMVRRAIADGIQVTIDEYPYAYSSTSMDLLFPSELLPVLHRSDPKRLLIVQGVLSVLARNGWDNLSFARIAWYGPDHSLEGKRIPEVCREFGKSCTSLREQAEMVVQLRLRSAAQMIYFDMDSDDVQTVLRYPDTMIGSDSRVRHGSETNKSHPRSFGTFPRVLASGVLSLPDAIRRMTGLPAQVFGLSDRGLIAVGRWADLTVFDPSDVRDLATLDEPLARPEGIHFVFVNGQAVVEHGIETENLPGWQLCREVWPGAPTLSLTLRGATVK